MFNFERPTPSPARTTSEAAPARNRRSTSARARHAHQPVLQRTRDDRAVQRMLSTMAADRIAVGRPGGAHERAADLAADRIVAGAEPTAPVAVGRDATQEAVVPGIAAGIRSARPAGRPVPAHVREAAERMLDADLSGVRLHLGDAAERLTARLAAVAFTSGRDVFIRRDQYSPHRPGGGRVMAHELAHVAMDGTSDVIHRAIARAPHGGGVAELNRVDNNKAANEPAVHQGVAPPPVRYVAPTFGIDVREGPQGCTATIRLGRHADQGDSEAAYIKAGDHDTNYLWNVGGVGDPAGARVRHPNLAGANDVEHVIQTVTSAVARGSKRAEQEHLDDYRRAFELSLGAAQAAIEEVAGGHFQGADAPAALASARQELLSALRDHSDGHLTTLDPRDWQTMYRRLFVLSSYNRDQPGFHTQSYEEDPHWNTPVLKRLAALKWGFPVHFVKVVQGGHFRLGESSERVIDFDYGGPA